MGVHEEDKHVRPIMWSYVTENGPICPRQRSGRHATVDVWQLVTTHLTSGHQSNDQEYSSNPHTTTAVQLHVQLRAVQRSVSESASYSVRVTPPSAKCCAVGRGQAECPCRYSTCFTLRTNRAPTGHAESGLWPRLARQKYGCTLYIAVQSTE